MSPLLFRLVAVAASTALLTTACARPLLAPEPSPPHHAPAATQKLPPQTSKTQHEELPTKIDAYRQALLDQHDQALIAYEEQDAIYARLELDQRLSKTLLTRLVELREMVLQMQVFLGRMIEYHNRSKAQRGTTHQESTALSPARQLAKRAHHEYHRYLTRVAEHQVELLRLHLTMGLLSKAQDHQEVSRRHDELARLHGQIARTCHQIQALMVQLYDLDPHDEEMRDPLEDTPEELNAPDLIETI